MMMSRLRFRIALLGLFTCFFSGFNSYQTCAQNNPGFIDTLFFGQRGFKNSRPKTGIAIALVKPESVKFYCFGNRERETGLPVDGNTVFEIGSNTKVFTGLLLANEIAHGTIDTNATIDKFLTENTQFSTRIRGKIRLVDLACFRSGLPTLHDDVYDSLLFQKDSLQPYKDIDENYFLSVLNKVISVPDYGVYQYSNFAYGVLGICLEKATGRSYSDLLQTRLFKSIGMQNSWTDMPGSDNLAIGYKKGKRVGFLELGKLEAAGAIKSSASDLAKFLQMQIGTTASTFEDAINLSQRVFLQASDFGVGLGWHVVPETDSSYSYMMQGDTIGMSSFLWFNKARKSGLVVLINEGDPQLRYQVVNFILKNL